VANAEARTLAHNLACPQDLRPYPHDWVPAAVFTEPQIATVGARQQDLAGGRPYVEAVQAYADTAYGWARQDTTASASCTATRRPGSCSAPTSSAIRPACSSSRWCRPPSPASGWPSWPGQYWIHPALTEVVENALLKLAARRRPGAEAGSAERRRRSRVQPPVQIDESSRERWYARCQPPPR